MVQFWHVDATREHVAFGRVAIVRWRTPVLVGNRRQKRSRVCPFRAVADKEPTGEKSVASPQFNLRALPKPVERGGRALVVAAADLPWPGPATLAERIPESIIGETQFVLHAIV